jgi:lipase (class 3)
MNGTSGPPYDDAQILMTLAAIAYAPPGDVASYLTNSSYATQGQWKLVWGPALSPTKGNLMYLAQNTAHPKEYAVAIRGTYPEFSVAMFVDLYQDLDVGHTVAWPYPAVPGAAVAAGTMDGLTDLTGMFAGGNPGVTLLTWLQQHLPAGATLYVTGHSLGGALVTVLAPWLAYQLQAAHAPAVTIAPYTFAGPTAGNKAFADFYSGLFTAYRYFNVIDIVPMAWSELSAVKKLFPAPGPSCPRVVADLVDLVEAWMRLFHRVSYAQPGAGTPLNGVPVGEVSFTDEAGDQHAHNNYLALLGAPPVSFDVVTGKVAVTVPAGA